MRVLVCGGRGVARAIRVIAPGSASHAAECRRSRAEPRAPDPSKTSSPRFQDPDLTRILPSGWRSPTIVVLSDVAKAFGVTSADQGGGKRRADIGVLFTTD